MLGEWQSGTPAGPPGLLTGRLIPPVSITQMHSTANIEKENKKEVQKLLKFIPNLYSFFMCGFSSVKYIFG